MLRFGKAMGHSTHGSGCACMTPALQQVTRRLDGVSRRSFLACVGATAAAGALSGTGHAQAPSKIFFTKARLFDAKSDSLQDAAQILIEGNRISAIDTSNNPAPSDATIVDCGDRVMMPGMIDNHWHTCFAAIPLNVLITSDPGIIFATATAEAERTLLRGFTTIRDLGGPVFSFKQAIDSGIIPGPRIFPSGAMITTSGGHADMRLPNEIPRESNSLSAGERLGGAAIVDDIGELKMRIREQLLQGASQIKLVAGGGVSSPRSPLDIMTFSEEELREGINVARDWNTYATVHASVDAPVKRALAAGAQCVEHGHLMEESTAQQMAAQGTWLSTQPYLSLEDVGGATGPAVARALSMFEGTPRIYEWAKKYGIKLAWGSDLLFSAALMPRQNTVLTHLTNWFTNAEVLRAATSQNGELLQLSNLRNPYPGRLGVIEPGTFADLLVVNGNPLDDIRLLEDPGANFSVIMKDGQFFKNTLGA